MKASKADIFAARIASDLQCFWQDLVELTSDAQNIANFDAVLTSVCQASGKSRKSMDTKVQAILHLLRDNSVEAVKELGEEDTLKRYQGWRKGMHPEKEEWSLKLPKSSKIALLSRMDRIGTLLGTRSRETQADWLCGHIDGLSDEEIKA